MEKVGFVILHYGSIAETDTCVRSIRHLSRQELIFIVIVDNEVRKPLAERMKIRSRYSHVPNAFVLENTGNGGFSEGNNLGYRYARETLGCDWIIAANNDTEFPQKDLLHQLDSVFHMAALDVHLYAPDIQRPDPRFPEGFEHQNPLDVRIRTAKEAKRTVFLNEMACRWYPLSLPFLYFQNSFSEKLRCRKAHASETPSAFSDSDIVPHGSCLICTPLFVQQESVLFDPETEFFYEEYLLALRCRKKGYRIRYKPQIIVLHESGAATKKTFRSAQKILLFRTARIAAACRIYLRELTGEPL